MSALSTPTDSPVHIEPLHHPSQAAKVVVPQAPLGNATNNPAKAAPGMGAKALLAKKMAKSINPKYISPTDNLMTPCSKKITSAKKKHFTKGPPQQLNLEPKLSEEEEDSDVEPIEADPLRSSDKPHPPDAKMDDEENPF